MPDDSLKICTEMVRESDRAQYLATLWQPAHDRPALWAVHAFCIELARIRSVVREPMLGAIRLAWWREALDGVYAHQPRAHPVLQALASTMPATGVTQLQLSQLVDGREVEFDDQAVVSIADAVQFADGTAGLQNEIVARICAGSALSVQQRAAARSIGTAWGIVRLINGVAFQARQQRMVLPTAALEAAGINPDTLFQTPLGANIAPVIKTLCTQATQLLDGGKGAPRAARLVGACTRDRLRTLHKVGYSVAELTDDAGDLGCQIALLKAGLFGIY